ncbi:DNA end-binding protein Ku [Candidatus Koribacter versatilis Ellin345]|uniref:Non-homologous end joining protein Ku n=1 Tax=Koribacter versatilis (strain Ellin345) TaxID=204669 RepID=KU_KORVE|nr:Ku protein [Candidatus Koribacter versatilis]Q1INE2.1 RecName: Full=Non-homologous end joining protein Ku [Candidatus Koribacter versatilis Ellin345]ABF41608.1 DNA end-binding protein Ku [Candidatus Koribacter versatilis Ellin345]
MAASVWSGYLTFGLISMPVRLFSGARGSRISFNQLHREDHARVKQQLVCSADGKVLERDEIVKGYEYRKGEYVIIDPEELKKIEPKTAKSMEILEFVKAEEVDPVYFETSYYLQPDEGGEKPYALLVQALKESDYMGIAKVTMHNREYTVFLRPHTSGIMLHTMYYEDEVRKMEAPKITSEVKPAEVKIAHQLIEALAGKFEPEKFHDVYEANVKKLIEAHLEGQDVEAVAKPAKPAKVVDLMDALKQSLAAMKDQKKGSRLAEVDKESTVQMTPKKPAVKERRGRKRVA